MANLKIPTDQEISEILGGIPVVSYYPEDLPHYKSSKYERLTRAEHEARAHEIAFLWVQFNRAAFRSSNLMECAWDTAVQRDAQLTTFEINNRPYLFCLLRPPRFSSSKNQFAERTDISSALVEDVIPKEDNDFLITYHEIGHMIPKVLQDKYETTFDEELDADAYALLKYIQAGGKKQVARNYIVGRALSGFLLQPHRYWLAQPLAAHFFRDVEDADQHEAFLSNAELRLRVTDITDNNKRLQSYSSQTIYAALNLFSNKKTFLIQDPILRDAIEKFDNIRKSKNANYSRNIQAVLSAVDEVSQNKNVERKTRQLAGLVIEGAKAFIPKLTPSYLFPQGSRPEENEGYSL